MGELEDVVQKRQLAIKLAKNMEPFDHTIGEEFDAIYIETLTEDIKQDAREIKKLVKIVGTIDGATSWEEWHQSLKLPLTVAVDGEEERVTKLMRRYCTRIQKMADLLYEVAYMDFDGLQQADIQRLMGVDDGSEEEDDE